MKDIPKEWKCPFNGYVKCLEKKGCEKCGWNPDIAKKRLQDVHKSRNQK